MVISETCLKARVSPTGQRPSTVSMHPCIRLTEHINIAQCHARALQRGETLLHVTFPLSKSLLATGTQTLCDVPVQ